MIGLLHIAKELCDFGASINLIPVSIGDLNPTKMRLLMVDATVKRPIGVLYVVLLKVELFIFPTDFVILDCEVDFEIPIILERPFLAIGDALVDMEKGQMKFWLNNEEATSNIYMSIKLSFEFQTVFVIFNTVQSVSELHIEERLSVAALEPVIINFEVDGIEEYDALVAALEQNEYLSKIKNWSWI